MRVQSIVVVAPVDVDYSFPRMGEIRDCQDIYTDGNAVWDSPLESVARGESGLYRVDYGGMQVIWAPPAKSSLRVRLMRSLICKMLNTGAFVLQRTDLGRTVRGKD